ncbi:MAG TPA: trigger factor [Usitatibacteraceae bacterium]|nr:trigger factor [Usitatibacteraceae bacterium]
MQQAVETKTSPLERQLKLAVPVAQLEAEIAERIRKLARTVKMQGFRPGKVPIKMVERHYGFQVRQEALSDTVQRQFADAVRSQNFRVAGLPRIEPVQAGADATAFEFQAVFEVYPEITMGELAERKVTRPVTEVSEKDVDATIETLRKQRATFERVERGAAKGDLVNIDFEGKVDDVPFEGGSGKNFTVVLGEGRMLPDFEAALAGLVEGEEKTFPIVFPEDYAEQLKGKTAQFTVKVNQVAQAKLPEVNAEFAKALGVEDGDLARMRTEIRQNVEREVKKRIQSRVKEQVMQGLAAAATFEVPRALLEGEVARMREAALADLKQRGMTTQNIELPDDIFAGQARHRVTLGLLVADLVRRNNLAAQAAQVRKVIEEHADSFEQPAEMVRWFYGQPERMAEVEAVVLEDNVVEWSLARMTVEDKPTAFEELMGTRKG